MIVTHSPKPYLPSTEKCNPHTGVIIGWNYKCKAAFIQKKLKSVAPHLSECCETRHMCFCKCYTCQSDNSRFTHQPHYIILAENNIVCYAPQGVYKILLITFSLINFIYFIWFFISLYILINIYKIYFFLFQILYQVVHQNG